MKQFYVTEAFVLYWCVMLNAQSSIAPDYWRQIHQPGANFYTICAQAEAWYAAHPEDTGEYSGIRQYSR
jgi:hypothetical protein